jgi:hypothetical protein
MHKIKNSNCNKHQCGIKNIQKQLMAQNVPGIPLYILYHSDHTTNQDQRAREIEDMHMFLPWHVGLCGFVGWRGVHAFVEEQRDEDEEAEGDDLDEEAAEDYVLGEGGVGAVSGG